MKDLINKLNNEYGPNPDNWDWHTISSRRKLTEEFIRKFQDKVYWNNISIYNN